MLVSADDATVPLIGYSETNSFPLTDMDPNVASWMSLYTEQIQASRRLAPYKVPAQTRAEDKPAISPLLKTTWNQTSPYNGQCPLIRGQRSVTGCVATAMAQVMKYWEYPPRGKGSLSYRPQQLDYDLSINFDETEFDWDNMLDSYGRNTTSVQNNAVATLMKACGYSVKMDYSPWSSGAYSRDIANALKTYFGYDQGAGLKDRDGYTSQEAWNNMVYQELVNVGPVILDGLSQDGAHCFVCDGYDGKGYFHINWGWGGLSDGYFLLNELTPGEVGVGGGDGHYSGYNMRQDAITGIMPPVGRLSCLGITIDNASSESGNVSGKGYIYRIDDPSNILVSVKLRITGGHITSPLYVTIYETDPETLKNEKVVLDTTFSNNINASDGEVTYTQSIRIDNFNPSKFYTLNFAYELKGKRTTIDSIKLAASSGVNGVAADSDSLEILNENGRITVKGEGMATIWVYDAAGRMVSHIKGYNPMVKADSLSPGVYLVKATDEKGATGSLKLLLR